MASYPTGMDTRYRPLYDQKGSYIRLMVGSGKQVVELDKARTLYPAGKRLIDINTIAGRIVVYFMQQHLAENRGPRGKKWRPWGELMMSTDKGAGTSVWDIKALPDSLRARVSRDEIVVSSTHAWAKLWNVGADDQNKGNATKDGFPGTMLKPGPGKRLAIPATEMKYGSKTRVRPDIPARTSKQRKAEILAEDKANPQYTRTSDWAISRAPLSVYGAAKWKGPVKLLKKGKGVFLPGHGFMFLDNDELMQITELYVEAGSAPTEKDLAKVIAEWKKHYPDRK